MPTVLQIIDRALEHIEIKGAGETTSAEDASLCLRALTSLLDSMQLDSHAIIGQRELVFTPAAGAQTVTIGPTVGLVTQDIDSWVPPSLSHASFYRADGCDTPLPLADAFEQYTQESPKNATGTPAVAFYGRQPGIGTLRLWPAADGLYELHLWAPREVVDGQEALALSDDLVLPHGYRNAIEYGLALEISASFNRSAAAPTMLARFSRAMAKVKRANFQSLQIAQPVVGYRWSVLDG